MKRILLLMFIIGVAFRSYGQNVSNEGRSFLCVFPSHDPNVELAQMNVIVTSKFDTRATVKIGSWTETQDIPANSNVYFQIPRDQAYIPVQSSNGVLGGRAISITVPGNMPKVAVYSHIFAGARSAATLLLPFESLGQSYYSMNYTQDEQQTANSTVTNFLIIAAAEDNTRVNITERNGNVRSIMLNNAGDVYQYTERGELTGTYVEVDKATSACKRIAVYSGSTSLTIGCPRGRDPLFQQLYGTNSWGKSYGFVPFKDQRFILRVLAKDPGTVISVNGVTYSLQPGQFYESPYLTEPGMVTSNNPVSVAQYALGQDCNDVSEPATDGDPDMVMLNPTEFGLKKVTMFSSSLRNIQNKFINVFIKNEGVSSFTINGDSYASAFVPVMANPAYSYAQISASVFSTLTMESKEVFNAIAYGFGNIESYGYSAGTNLAATQYIKVEDKQTGLLSDEACIVNTYRLKITVPAQAIKLTWRFQDGSPEYIDNNPVAVTSTVGDQTFYTYTLPIDKTYSTPGINPVLVIAQAPNTANGCSIGETEYSFDVVVNPLPIPDFSTSIPACASREVTFTDQSTIANGFSVSEWRWDFGDGSTSDLQNPVHTYAAAGSYTVTLVTISGSGCASTPVTKTVVINATPVALFLATQTSCTNTAVRFTDQSTTGSGSTIVKWIWTYGDGATEERSSATGAEHQYAATGTYTISLVTETSAGCRSDVFTKDIVITMLPVAGFDIPDVCLLDAMATFNNTSANLDGTKNGLTYAWNYGDPGSGALNTSTGEQGAHKYTAVGTYNVTLTITNENGCVASQVNTISVNGAFPVAAFVVETGDPLCSNQELIVRNTSTVNAGNITRLEWFFDYIGAPTQMVVDEDPLPGKTYTYNYPVFSAPLTRNVTIRLVAYSGGVCFSSTMQSIVLKASPVVQFTALPDICLNSGRLQLTQASETGQSAGNGVYSGPGITPGGLFDPVLAGVGTHTITYTFTNDNGCEDSKTQQIIVGDPPRVNAGPDLYVLEGGSLMIKATATGNNLSYKWTPSIGLSADNVLNPSVTPSEDTDYMLTVTSGEGCISTDKVFVSVLQAVVPINSFSPNGDGVNDVWTIKYIDSYPKATVEIFSRYGERIFFSNGYAVPFDGTYKNLSLPVGTYYYVINPGNGRPPLKGSVTLIR